MNATETDVVAETKQMLKEGVTVEYQRRKAKEMVKFFKQQACDQAVEDSQVFGWTPKSEINNGRWTMFDLVGMMTEYATVGLYRSDQAHHLRPRHRRHLRLKR